MITIHWRSWQTDDNCITSCSVCATRTCPLTDQPFAPVILAHFLFFLTHNNNNNHLYHVRTIFTITWIIELFYSRNDVEQLSLLFSLFASQHYLSIDLTTRDHFLTSLCSLNNAHKQLLTCNTKQTNNNNNDNNYKSTF